MAHIFISYSRADSLFIEKLVPLLAEIFPEHEIWYDLHIAGGEHWWYRILHEINSCDLFIYLLSNDSLESEYCQAEFREALRLQKRCLPVIIRPKTSVNRAPDDLEAEIHLRNWVDMSSGFSDYQANAKLYAAIHQHLNTLPQIPLAPLSPEPVDKPDVPVAQKHAIRGLTGNQVVLIVAVIGLIGTLGAALITGMFGMLATTSAGTPAAGQSTDLPTLTETPTLEIALIVQTLDAQATLEQATLNVQATAAARATEYAVGTQSVFDQTATATLWTLTPTANITASIEAYRTQQASDLTATADIWTDTPTSTPSPTLSPEQLARTPVTANADWTPYERNFGGIRTMVLVPAGCFDMGSEDGPANEQPVHEICFDEPFWIDKYEVINGQFILFGSTTEIESRWSGYNLPREQINWIEARDFCEQLRARLPTEAEWEYAARGPDGWVYPWGNLWNSDGVVWNRSQTADVGSYPIGVSWVGALDMSGNVSEWTSSLYQSYPYDNTHENSAVGTDISDVRAVRGGAWIDPFMGYLRTTSRRGNVPRARSSSIGFRCVRSASDS